MNMTRKKQRDLRAELEKKAEEHYYTMRDGTKIRVLEFNLAKEPHEVILFFIPGFVTVFQSWEKVLEPLTKEFRIYYFESREKASSISPSRRVERRNALEKMAYDIKEVIEQMELDKQKYVTISSSTGGTIEVAALSKQWHKPLGAVMVGPTMEYHVHWIAPLFVSLIPEFIKKMFMPILRWYMGAVYVNKKENPEQYAKYIRAGEEAKIRKIRRILWQMTKYKCWEMAPKVTTETLLVGASSDKMHATEECVKTHELMPNSTFVDLGSNKATHSQPLVDEIIKFIEEINKE
jgi:alpha-beta hydrolase superfamily lysophospholipase